MYCYVVAVTIKTEKHQWFIFSIQIRKRKLEKADILELTVKHLKNLQRFQSCE